METSPSYYMPVPSNSITSQELDVLVESDFLNLTSFPSTVSSLFASIYTFAKDKVQHYIPKPLQINTIESLQVAKNVTNQVSVKTYQVASHLILGLDEMTDFARETINPDLSIETSLIRLEKCHSQLFPLCVWAAHKGNEAYKQQTPQLRKIIAGCMRIQEKKSVEEELEMMKFMEADPIGATFSVFIQDLLSYFNELKKGLLDLFDGHEELIGKTIQANILNICANLLTSACARQERLNKPEEFQTDPIGSVLALVGGVIVRHISFIRAIEQLQSEDKERKMQLIFIELSNELLELVFLKKEKDIQLFHPLFPVRQLQKFIWEKVQTKLPQLLYQIYQGCNKSVQGEHPLWLQDFDQFTKVEGVQQLHTLPSKLFQMWVNQEGQLEKIQPLLERWMQTQQIIGGTELSHLLAKSIKNNIMTPNTFLVKIGVFLEQLINPLLTEKVLRILNPILKKQQEDKDLLQKLATALLPLLANHLNDISAAQCRPGGLNFENFVQVAAGHLHPAVSRGGVDKAKHRQEHFYQPQSDLLLQTLFPGGQEELATIVPGLKPEQYAFIWKKIETLVQTNLPKIIPQIFNQKFWTKLLVTLFNKVIDKLSAPIELSSRSTNNSRIEREAHRIELSPAELLLQKQKDLSVGKFVIQGLQFLNLPLNKLDQMPNWLKKLSRWEELKEKTLEAVGRKIRTQFGETFIRDCLQETLKGKRTQGKAKPIAQVNRKKTEDLVELEQELVHVTLHYVFRLLGAKIVQTLDCSNQVMKKINEAILAIGTVIILKVLAPLLKRIGVEAFIERKLFQKIHALDRQAIEILGQADIHENVIFQAIKAIEQVWS